MTSRTERLAALFQSRPGEWIDGMKLTGIAGGYAWRSRVSDIRKPPYNLTIENRQRRVERRDGTHFVVSEYRCVPDCAGSRSVTATSEAVATGGGPGDEHDVVMK